MSLHESSRRKYVLGWNVYSASSPTSETVFTVTLISTFGLPFQPSTGWTRTSQTPLPWELALAYHVPAAPGCSGSAEPTE